MSNKLLIGAIVLSLVLSAASLYVAIAPSLGSHSFGSLGVKLAENYDPYLRYNGGYYSALPIETTSTLQVGAGGSVINQIAFGACTVWAGATTIAATSTAQVVCQGATNGSIAALANVNANANCSVTAASSTNTTLAGLVVEGQSASSTAGSIVFQLANLTGTTFTWSSAASSSNNWNYQCLN